MQSPALAAPRAVASEVLSVTFTVRRQGGSGCSGPLGGIEASPSGGTTTSGAAVPPSDVPDGAPGDVASTAGAASPPGPSPPMGPPPGPPPLPPGEADGFDDEQAVAAMARASRRDEPRDLRGCCMGPRYYHRRNDLLPNEMARVVSALAAGGVAAMKRAFGRP